MKVSVALNRPPAFSFKSDLGTVKSSWITKDSEDAYGKRLPKVATPDLRLELEIISVKKTGQQIGQKLMKLFLDSPAAQAAQLIFLEASPNTQNSAFDENMSDEEILSVLVKFYKKFQFVEAHRYAHGTVLMYRLQQ